MSMKDIIPINIRIGDVLINGKGEIGTLDDFTEYPGLPYRIYWHKSQKYGMISTEQFLEFKSNVKTFRSKYTD